MLQVWGGCRCDTLELVLQVWGGCRCDTLELVLQVWGGCRCDYDSEAQVFSIT